MQIRLTVLRPRGGPSTDGPAADVLVTAPAGTTLGAVAGALAGAVGVRGGRTATHVHLYAGPQRLDERTPLGSPPLVDGAVLSVDGPAAGHGAEGGPAAAELRVAGGPDAGGVHLLHPGRVRVGRSGEADVPLDDPDVSRLHLELHVSPDGWVTAADPGSTNGTTLDGAPVGAEPVPVPVGGLLRVGESSLVLAARTPLAEALRPATPDGQGHLQLAPPPPHRPPAAPGAPPQAPAAAPDPDPEPALGRGLRRIGDTLRRGGRGAAEEARTAGRAAAQERARARTREAAALRDRQPDPAALLLAALDRGPLLWERGPGHPGFLALRLGTADRPADHGGVLPAVPVTVDLRAAGSLGLAGPRPRLAGLARAAVARLAALHSPSALEVVLVSADPGRPAEARTEEWSWAFWLPHLRPSQGQECRLLVGLDAVQAAARLAELASRLDGPVRHGGPAAVLVLDGDPGSDAARRDAALLAARGAAAGVHVLALAEESGGLPPGLGATAVVGGEVGTQLRVERPVRGAAGPRRETVDGVALDAVSAAWAERLARALAPLRESAPAARGPLPAALRLLDLLDLDMVTPAKISGRWAEPPATAGPAPAVLGTARDGRCTVDLADRELLGPGLSGGPHLLVGGAPGSGKTELLRTLVASLAVAERPDRLSVVVIEGREPADPALGLYACTDLPHVSTYLGADVDPVRTAEAAEALLAELDRREELLRGRDFGAWYADGMLRAAGAGRPAGGVRLVPQRTAPDGRDPGTGPGTGAGAGLGRERDRAALRTAAGPVRAVAASAGAPNGAGAPAALAQAPTGRLLVVVDDVDALVGGEGAGRAAADPSARARAALGRALAAVAVRGGRLGVHLAVSTGRPERTAGTEVDEAALLRIALRTDDPDLSRLLVHVEDAAALGEDTPGRGYLRLPDGRVTAFQGARVSGRIPRTATLRPTVVALDWSQAGAPPGRRPVRELGNGPTDLALLASALQRAAGSLGAAAAPPLV
ncbi:FtsK/SpoIIIE domain-containing protein [Streptomyces sp. NPDC001380]|uniref:FtsK/SpoIIIE domain-containing protein n=1 Tax=Streptomyces sp. NPDC001380 TaxID=3364566 RepID=UPI00369F21AC